MRRTFRWAKRLRNRDVGYLFWRKRHWQRKFLAKPYISQAAGERRRSLAVNCAAIPESLIESELFAMWPEHLPPRVPKRHARRY